MKPPQPAFPQGDQTEFGAENGMTYRQWLAGHLAQGLVVDPSMSEENIASASWRIADAIIKAEPK